MMKKCPYCTRDNKNDAYFCQYCGKALPVVPQIDKPPKLKRTSTNGKKGLIITLGILTPIISIIIVVSICSSLFFINRTGSSPTNEEVIAKPTYDPTLTRVVEKYSGPLQTITADQLDQLDVVNYCGNFGRMVFSPTSDYGVTISNLGFIIQDLVDLSKRTFVLTSVNKKSIRISPDGSLIGFSDKNGIYLWNRQGEFVKIFQLEDMGDLFAFSPDNESLAAVKKGNRIVILNLQTGTQTSKITSPDEESIEFLDFSPDGKNLLFGYDNYIGFTEYAGNSKLFVLSMASKKLISEFETSNTVKEVDYSLDSTTLIILSTLPSDSDKFIYQTFSISSSEISIERTFYTSLYVASYLYLPSTESIYIQSLDNKSHITEINAINLKTNEQKIIFSDYISDWRLSNFQISPNEKYFFVMGDPLFSYLYDLQNQKVINYQLSKAQDHHIYVDNIFSLNDDILRISDNRFVYLYSNCGSTGEELIWGNMYTNSTATSSNGLFSIQYSPEEENQMYRVVWNNAEDIHVSVLEEVEPHENGYNFSPDGTLISKVDQKISIFRTLDGSLLNQYEEHETEDSYGKLYVRKAIISNDNRYMASLGYDGTIRIWDVLSGDQLVVIEGANAEYDQEMSFSTNGSTLYYLYSDVLRAYLIPSGELKSQTTLSTANGFSVFTVTPDDALVAVSTDIGVDIYTLSNGNLIKSLVMDLPPSRVALRYMQTSIQRMSFSHDGTMLAIDLNDFDFANSSGPILIYGIK